MVAVASNHVGELTLHAMGRTNPALVRRAVLCRGMVGYSGTPLATKLGIQAGHHVVLLGAPAGFAAMLAPLPPVKLSSALRAAADVVVLFVTARAQLERRFAAIVARLQPAGGFWVAWPKRASKVPTDMTEDVVRLVALPQGLVDNKVCAIDDVWSGLRLVIRKELRTALPPKLPTTKTTKAPKATKAPKTVKPVKTVKMTAATPKRPRSPTPKATTSPRPRGRR